MFVGILTNSRKMKERIGSTLPRKEKKRREREEAEEERSIRSKNRITRIMRGASCEGATTHTHTDEGKSACKIRFSDADTHARMQARAAYGVHDG